MTWLRTSLAHGAVTASCSGCFRAPGHADVVLLTHDSLVLLPEVPAGSLHGGLRQPLLCGVTQAACLPACRSSGSSGAEVSARLSQHSRACAPCSNAARHLACVRASTPRCCTTRRWTIWCCCWKQAWQCCALTSSSAGALLGARSSCKRSMHGLFAHLHCCLYRCRFCIIGQLALTASGGSMLGLPWHLRRCCGMRCRAR